jgi:hexosaminidase
MPDSVTFEISDDGQIYKLIGTAQNTISERQAGSVIHDFSIELQQASARYIRIRATNRRTCPDWHPGSGSKSWLFVDEIIIR